MAKIQEDILLANIVREIENDPSIETLSGLSEELQQDIIDSVPCLVRNRELRTVHTFLLGATSQDSSRQMLKMKLV